MVINKLNFFYDKVLHLGVLSMFTIGCTKFNVNSKRLTGGKGKYYGCDIDVT